MATRKSGAGRFSTGGRRVKLSELLVHQRASGIEEAEMSEREHQIARIDRHLKRLDAAFHRMIKGCKAPNGALRENCYRPISQRYRLRKRQLEDERLVLCLSIMGGVVQEMVPRLEEMAGRFQDLGMAMSNVRKAADPRWWQPNT